MASAASPAPVGDGSFRFLEELDNKDEIAKLQKAQVKGKSGQLVQGGIKARSDMNALTLFFSRLRRITVNVEIGNKTYALGRGSLEKFLLRNAAQAGITNLSKKLSYDELAKHLKIYLSNMSKETDYFNKIKETRKDDMRKALKDTETGERAKFEVLGSYHSDYKLTPREILKILLAIHLPSQAVKKHSSHIPQPPAPHTPPVGSSAPHSQGSEQPVPVKTATPKALLAAVVLQPGGSAAAGSSVAAVANALAAKSLSAQALASQLPAAVVNAAVTAVDAAALDDPPTVVLSPAPASPAASGGPSHVSASAATGPSVGASTPKQPAGSAASSTAASSTAASALQQQKLKALLEARPNWLKKDGNYTKTALSNNKPAELETNLNEALAKSPVTLGPKSDLYYYIVKRLDACINDTEKFNKIFDTLLKLPLPELELLYEFADKTQTFSLEAPTAYESGTRVTLGIAVARKRSPD